MTQEKFGYVNDQAREFLSQLYSYVPKVDENPYLKPIRHYTLDGGDRLDVFRAGSSLVLVESGKGSSSDIEKRVEIYIDSENQSDINRAMKTLTQITGFEPYRGKN